MMQVSVRCCCFFFILAILFFAPVQCVWADDDTAPATALAEAEKSRRFSTGTAFFDDADISGGIYYFHRERRRENPDTGNYRTNLNHASVQASAAFSSGFIGDFLGFDFGIFGSADTKNRGAVDHEMSFVPWGDPWHPDWSAVDTKDGVSVYLAALKTRLGPFWGTGGYYQPAGPGVLGVNWSILPGTYRGVNAGADVGGFSVAVAWADAYKSPWFKEMNDFYKNDGTSGIPWLWSAGIRYQFETGLSLEAAYGESKGHLQNGHVKTRYETRWGQNPVATGYQLYLMRDNDGSGASENDNFDGTASHHYAFFQYEPGPWVFKLEGTYTRAPVDNEFQRGYFAYRLTDRNGSSKGAYDIWWDAHTDWNHHNEKAVFFKVDRRLDDLFPISGFSVGLGAGIGWEGEAYNTDEYLKEWAFTLDIGYVCPSGPLKDAFVKLHFTEYRNGTSLPDWEPFKNGFQSEHDVKFFAGILF
ncbi:OprD family porin [Desulfosarcina sp. OttesenSCG-928-B08]|nr:OprD family porin [Desulfosarcina sp. OttesenSCG-928-B08]